MTEPKLFVPKLAPLYDQTRDYGWLLVRLTAGGFLLVHGLQKVFGTTITAFAANSMARAAKTARRRQPARNFSSVSGSPLRAGSRGSRPGNRLASVYHCLRAGSCQRRFDA
jgi:hypothetical protein